jgi:SAM-dependent methyltransferase
VQANTGDGYAPRLRCPRCGHDLGPVPSPPATVTCTSCAFDIAWTGEYWDACADASFPRDFARQWVLWEQGKLGDPSLVYGKPPEHYFEQLLSQTGIGRERLRRMRVLEVGFGHGRTLRQVQEVGALAWGIDLATPLPSARLRPGSAFFANLLEMPFVPGQFDLVICRGVIHHTPDPAVSFKCVADQVAAGGMLYLGGCYEPGTRGILEVRSLLPRSWSYPEWLLLSAASIVTALRAVLEGIRRRTLAPSFFKHHYRVSRLEVFDVFAPRWSCRLGAEIVMPWFESQGFRAGKVGDGSYVGVK